MSKKRDPAPSEICVRRDRIKHVSLAIMGVCLLVAALLAIAYPLPYAENETWMRISFGGFGIPLSLWLLVVNVRNLTTRSMAIRIDERGILDESSWMSPGFIAWDDVSDVYLLHLKNGSYICVQPKDEQAWLATLGSRQQRLAKANEDIGFAPIRVQFAAVTASLTSEDGLAVIKGLHPELVRRARSPKY